MRLGGRSTTPSQDTRANEQTHIGRGPSALQPAREGAGVHTKKALMQRTTTPPQGKQYRKRDAGVTGCTHAKAPQHMQPQTNAGRNP